MKIKSLVTFIRKGLGFKGKSEHNGRGVYDMYSTDDVSPDVVIERVRSLLPKWEELGYVEKVDDNEKVLSVLFKRSAFMDTSERYRELFVVKHPSFYDGELCQICFCF